MNEQPTNYPLSWPLGWKRIPSHKREISRFADRSVAKAIQFVLDELRRLGARNPVISTNLQIRQDGLPKSNQRRPDDPGVAAYFILGGNPRVLACDKWTTVEDNLWAIGLHIENLRGIDRYGVGTVEQAFTGYMALPASSDWWKILGVAQTANMSEITTAYRVKAKATHPDQGGGNEEFLRVQQAYEQAQREKR